MKLPPLNFKKRYYQYLIAATLISSLTTSCSKSEVSTITADKKISSIMGVNEDSTFSSARSQSGLLRETWANIYGNDVVQIPLQKTPSSSSLLAALEGPVNSGENYGVRLRGYIVPPETGKYTFWIAADDAGELWLSTDANPVNKVRIANTLSWTNSREWSKFSSQKSDPIDLKAGQKYYLEILHKQGGGGDNLAVQWMLPDGTIQCPVPGSSLAEYTEQTDLNYTSSPVINLYGQHDLTISDKIFSGGGEPLITLTNCYNIHIKGNKLANSTNVGLYLYNCKNIVIEDNFFTNVSTGVYADHCSEGGIVVNNNQFLNMKGPFPRGQFVQFNNVRGAGSSIINNRGENILGRSYPEDAISLYQSAGTPSSPVIIKGNWIRGGGPSESGGGIMLGDNGGSYLTATDNILVDPGQFGMAIAGGDHNSIYNNLIYGREQPFTNVGLYINDIGGYKTTDCLIRDNKVRYYNKVNYQNNAWISPNSAKPEGWDTNIFGAAIDASILPEVIITKK